ncbi:MAG: thiamine biosynthesis protein ThiS [Frankiales bacterium]|nr:thiamine biosynthesis protein ThiS [Frankiales bacterium]
MAIVRFFAAARAAAGASEREIHAGTLADALDAVRKTGDARLSQVLGLCSFLVDGDPVGSRDHSAVALGEASVVDCLPPFAGG